MSNKELRAILRETDIPQAHIIDRHELEKIARLAMMEKARADIVAKSLHSSNDLVERERRASASSTETRALRQAAEQKKPGATRYHLTTKPSSAERTKGFNFKDKFFFLATKEKDVTFFFCSILGFVFVCSFLK